MCFFEKNIFNCPYINFNTFILINKIINNLQRKFNEIEIVKSEN